MITTELILLAIGTYLIAGTIKGTIGIGLPTAAIGILSQFSEPRLAITLAVFPILISNAWQAFREGNIIETFKTYWLFALAMVLVMGSMTVVTASIDTNHLIIILGSAIVLFAATSLLVTLPVLPMRFDRAAQLVAGSLAGGIGGLTAIWAPPMVIYLLARRVDKHEFVRVTGVLIFLGSIPLVIGFWQTGLLAGEVALLSIGMVVPSLIGYTIGELIRRKLDADWFRTIMLLIFLVMGLNLVRRALFGNY